MERDERIYKLKNGSDTAQWAAREILRLERELHALASDVVSCGCGHVTAGMRDRLRQTAGKAAGWVSVDDSLPDMDVPVWLQTDHGVLIGLRTDAGDEGWLWGRCYSAPWINRDGVWVADGECDDDYHATAWHPLPVPPKVSGEDEK